MMKVMKGVLAKTWVKVSLLLVALLMVGLVILTGYQSSKRYLIDQFVAARTKTSGSAFENIKEYLVWSDTGDKVTNDDVQYSNYKAISKKEGEKLKAALQKNLDDSLSLKRVGSRFLFFPDYRIAVKPMSLTIKTNVKGVDVLLNQKMVARTTSDNFSQTIKRLPAAQYRASIEGTYKNRPISLAKSYDGKSNMIDLKVAFKTFKVTSNLLDGDLYFGSDRIGTLDAGTYAVEDYPVTSSSAAYVKKNFVDGVVSSKKVKLSTITNGGQVALDAKDLLSQEKAGQVLVAVFNQLLAYLTYGKDPSDLATVFEDGANNDFYKGLKDSIKAKFGTDSRHASTLSINNIALTQLTQVGKESYQVNFNASYDFNYDKATDPAKGTHGHIIQQLAGSLVLKKSGNSYVVSKSGQKSLKVASEDNQVKADSIFPEKLIGTWSGELDGRQLKMTFNNDGTVTKTLVDKDKKEGDKNTAKVTKIEEKAAGTYVYTYADGTDTSAFVASSGIGGVGIKYAYGFKLTGDKLIPLIWQAKTDGDFDYSKPLEGANLHKE